jgi:type IV pilus assembly protein PilP
MKSLGYALMAVIFVLALAGCGASGEDELRQWMAEQRSQTRPRVVPIPEPKQFTPEPYAQAGAVDPFSKEKLAQALKRETLQSVASGVLIAPELARRKEPLEAFPLDAMTMVGSLHKEGKPVALVTVDKLLYQVRPGNYLGQNYGRIIKITETEVTLREIVQDAVGEWVERPAMLQLQERSK